MTDIEQDVSEDSPGFHLFAKLGLSIESLAAQLKRDNDIRQRRLTILPRYVPMEKLSVGSALVDFGAPQNGRVWTVRLLGAAESPDPTIANISNVTWYIGPYVPGAAPTNFLPITSARDCFATGLPVFRTYTSNVHQVLANQHLVAGVTGVPASPHNAIALVAVILDQPQWAAAEVVTME